MLVRSAARLDFPVNPVPMTSPDDKTVIVPHPPEPDSPPATVDPAGADSATLMPSAFAGPESHYALSVGTRVAEFEIKELIGEGGFGIVYLAYDTQLGRNVALKEYMPAALASRGSNAEVTVRSERHEETFRAGLKSFVNEARLLAQFDHHSLVKVYRFWEANGTAYMVMPYYQGATLRDALKARNAPPDEAWLRTLLTSLVSALDVMHRSQCYHRDIAPDNILLLKDSGRPLLLDFGAARRVIGDMTQALTVILKPGYAPIEQYAEVASLKQGPWTDIYALGAVVYFAIVGRTPPPSVGRMMSDSYVPLATHAAGRYSLAFLQAIDHALAVRPEERPQSVQALAEELGLALTGQDSAREEPIASASPPAAKPAASGGVTAREASGAATRENPPASGAGGNASADAATALRTTSRRSAIAVGVVAVVGLAALGGWFAMRPSTTTTPPTTAGATEGSRPSPSGPAHAQTVPSPAPPTPPVASTGPQAPPENGPASAAPSMAANTAAPNAAQPATPPLQPYTPAGELDRIVALADPSIRVTATSRSTTARIGKDHLQFKVDSSHAGYVYVFMVDPAGQYLMLFPNGLDKNNAIAAGQTLSLPRASWPMMAGAPAGQNHFLVMVSSAPRDFSDGGLRSESVFADFPAEAQRAAASDRTVSSSPFAGKPRCTASATRCPDTFGASTFTIDVVGPST
ncbi:Serine/threonine protein kinase [Paraburkholderia caribensis MBA4]|uniref:Serine/threonine protein kinase n=1 Tax=Paraburkholderia caribensis MBA4 TaxID=1323664 RepID=A0A0P0RER3_9BURK|nr:serine/threonine-protein kinase [Paraburkholderia caribensis]ALL66880.1 Serine/threonine protein kinase [Paraburkholderia caribensis MBA4]